MSRKVSGIIIAVLSLLLVGTGFYLKNVTAELNTARLGNAQLNQDLASADKENETLNQQIEKADAVIGEQKEGLGKAKDEISYWQGRANLGEFASVDELEAWLAVDNTDSTFYFYEGFTLPYDCDDYAIALGINAAKAGYRVSTQITGDHMHNSTIIGNAIYFIEPMTDLVWLWGHRD